MDEVKLANGLENDKTYKIVAHDIEQYLSLVEKHPFKVSGIDREFNYKTRDAKRYRWQVLETLVKKGELLKLGADTYRKLDAELPETDWQAADSLGTMNIRLPFNLHKLVKIFPKSIIIVAGSPNAGKTAWLYNFVVMNYGEFVIDLYNSETSPEQMKERFDNFVIPIPTPAPFRVFERYDNYADVIKPDGISVIDYLDLNSDFYLIGDEIEKIFRKLNKGLAVIGLQKRAGQELAIGGTGTEKKASLYITLDSGILTIKKAKSWMNPEVNPNGIKFTYKLVGGCKYVDVQRTTE